MQEEIQTLKNKVRTTRLSRINAEKRLLFKHKFFEFINLYYSSLIIIFSVINLIRPNESLGEMTLYLSISLLMCVLHVQSKGYNQRALQFRENYINMQKIEFQLNQSLSKVNYDDLFTQYCSLLRDCENHISYDYYKCLVHLLDSGNDSRSYYTLFKYAFHLLIRFAGYLFCICFPIICFILVIL